VIRGHN